VSKAIAPIVNRRKNAMEMNKSEQYDGLITAIVRLKDQRDEAIARMLGRIRLGDEIQASHETWHAVKLAKACEAVDIAMSEVF